MTRRNAHGFSDDIDTYRTFGGQLFHAWLEFPSMERIAQYRAAGVRCRRQKTTLFVHREDLNKAAIVDAEDHT